MLQLQIYYSYYFQQNQFSYLYNNMTLLQTDQPIEQIINLINSGRPNPIFKPTLNVLDQKKLQISTNLNKIFQYRTLVFKPWSGKSRNNQFEYKSNDQPMNQEQIKEEVQQEDQQQYQQKCQKIENVKYSSKSNDHERGYFYKFQNGNVKLIKFLLQQNGFKDCPENFNNWTIYWSCGPAKLQLYANLLPYQKVNHYPNSFQITRKDLMNKNISKMQIKYGITNFNFLPKTFILPKQIDQLTQQYRKNKRIYIVKPHNRSQGKGIIVTDDIDIILSRLEKYSSLVVSQYIENPLLINGYKFDLRIYVGITSVYPLRIYIYEEGLARFATEIYTTQMSSQKKNFRHLTNYSVNKKNQNFMASTTGEDDYYGSKWSLTALKDFLEYNIGKSETVQLFEKIDDLVIKTILSIENQLYTSLQTYVPYINNCFEILGFDVLIDSALKPWLIQVNLSPSMNTDSPLDLKIKGNVVADMFTLLGIVPESIRYTNNNHLRNLTEKYIKVKHNVGGINRGDLLIDKYILKETEAQQSRCGRWRKVYPIQNSFKYKNFFEVERHFNGVLRDVFLIKNEVIREKSVSTAYSQNMKKNIRISKKKDLKSLRRI